jgi:MoaA/NifB/PqqE/SkfB family radical SAM enzyme
VESVVSVDDSLLIHSGQAFEQIARVFPRVRHVHLQGWGEPLLHPRLFEMVALAKMNFKYPEQFIERHGAYGTNRK